MLAALMLVAAVGYAGAVIWLLREETRLVFRAGRTLASGRPSFPYEQIELPRADGVRQFAWVIPAADSGAERWVLYFHGNVTTVASQVNISHYRLLRSLGMNVLAPEFQGFGGLEGVPTESTLRADARAAYDHLRDGRKVPPTAIVIYGWSLGSAVAVDMASATPPAAVILEGAPASLVDLTTRKYPLFPLRLLMRSSALDSIRKIGQVSAPMLFLHASDDEIVPVGDGRRLFEAAGGAKTFVEVRGGHVSAIDVDVQQFERAIREFLARLESARISSTPNSQLPTPKAPDSQPLGGRRNK